MTKPRLWLDGGLGEAVVELTHPSSGNVDEHAVEGLRSVFRHVQPEAKHRAEESPGLVGDAEGDRAVKTAAEKHIPRRALQVARQLAQR